MNFIYQEFISDLSICDNLIQLFKENKNYWNQGRCKDGVHLELKKSTDMPISIEAIISNDIIKSYINELNNISKNYIKKYDFCNKTDLWGIVEDFNIQFYKPNEAFYDWHCERPTSVLPYCNRHLVWMTYLNDIKNDGETEFYYQQLKIKPEKGKTVIFPVDWTHTHRGITSKKDEKYIITGWFNYLNKV
jgi:hypothetical protein